jgi:hypothetical protein
MSFKLPYAFSENKFESNSGYPFRNSLISLNDWLIVPIKRILPFGTHIEISSFVIGCIIDFAKIATLLTLSNINYSISQVLAIAFLLFNLALSGLISLLIVHSLFCWTKAYSPTKFCLMK